MTQQNTDQAQEVSQPSLPPCLAVVLPPLLVVLEAKTASFKHAESEIFGRNERIAEVGRWIEAARSVADTANAESLAILKTVGSTPKDVLKAKAKQRGALEDIETFKSVIADVESDIKHWELKAHQAAGAVRSAHDAVRDAAIARLNDAVIEGLPPELIMLVQLIAEVSRSGDSALFNVDPTVKTPLDFALREASIIILAAIRANLHDVGACAILPTLPPSLDLFGKSPMQIHRLTQELLHQGGAQ